MEIGCNGAIQHPEDDSVGNGLFYLDGFSIDEFKGHLNKVTMQNWMRCIDEALRKSGHNRTDIDFLNMLLVKPSARQEILQQLGLSEEQSVYDDTHGHVGEQDGIINIIEGEKHGRLNDGDLTIIFAAGVGYVWSAACVRWGPTEA